MLNYIDVATINRQRKLFSSTKSMGFTAMATGIYKSLKAHWYGFLDSSVDVEDHMHLWDTVAWMHDMLYKPEPVKPVSDCDACKVNVNELLYDLAQARQRNKDLFKENLELQGELEIKTLEADRLDSALNAVNQGLEHLLNQ